MCTCILLIHPNKHHKHKHHINRISIYVGFCGHVTTRGVTTTSQPRPRSRATRPPEEVHLKHHWRFPKITTKSSKSLDHFCVETHGDFGPPILGIRLTHIQSHIQSHSIAIKTHPSLIALVPGHCPTSDRCDGPLPGAAKEIGRLWKWKTPFNPNKLLENWILGILLYRKKKTNNHWTGKRMNMMIIHWVLGHPILKQTQKRHSGTGLNLMVCCSTAQSLTLTEIQNGYICIYIYTCCKHI